MPSITNEVRMTFTQEEVENDLAALAADGLIEPKSIEEAVEQDLAQPDGHGLYHYSPTGLLNRRHSMKSAIDKPEKVLCDEAIMRRALILRLQGITYAAINKQLGLNCSRSWLNGRTKVSAAILEAIKQADAE